MAEPTCDPARRPGLLGDICDLAAAGIEIDGQAQVAESTWVVYGYTSYDGEVIVGEYHDARTASEAWRAVARAVPGGRTAPGDGRSAR